MTIQQDDQPGLSLLPEVAASLSGEQVPGRVLMARQVRTWCATADFTVTADEVFVSIPGMGPAVPLTATVALAAFRCDNPIYEDVWAVEPHEAADGAADAVEQVRAGVRARVVDALASATASRERDRAALEAGHRRAADLAAALADAGGRGGGGR